MISLSLPIIRHTLEVLNQSYIKVLTFCKALVIFLIVLIGLRTNPLPSKSIAPHLIPLVIILHPSLSLFPKQIYCC